MKLFMHFWFKIATNNACTTSPLLNAELKSNIKNKSHFLRIEGLKNLPQLETR